jgi:dTDP-4-dehydrorhamnose reductase
MAQKYIIIGAGYIGKYLFKKLAPDASLFVGHVCDTKILESILLEGYPGHVLINCAGKTGRPNIDWCEDHKDQTFGANVGLPVMIAEMCKKLGKYWIHIGSGCIYDGYERDWDEEDAPNFYGSFYSKSKIWSQDILAGYDEPLVLRIRMPIDENLEERNYISKIVKYAREGKAIFSLPNSMTILSDLANAIKFLGERGETGEFNVVNNGVVESQDILELYKTYIDPSLDFKIGDKDIIESTLKAKRSNCILSCDKLEGIGFRMPDLSKSIEKILKEYSKINH